MEQKRRLVSSIVVATIFLTTGTLLHADSAFDLRASENGRFLVHRDGSGFFPVADTAWAIAWRLTRPEVEDYMRHRKDQKFNTVAMVTFPSYEGAKIIPNAYGDFAFELKDRVWDPGRPVTTPGENPENATEYDYWDHLEYIIDTANARGMYVVLLPAWGCYVAGSYVKGAPGPEIVFNGGSAYEYGHWMGERFSEKKNIIWMMGGDRSAVYGDRDYRDVFQAMAEGVADGVNGVHKQDSEADYSTTLMSYHPRKWHPNSSEWFHNDPWLDFNSMQDQPTDQIAATELDYGLSPAKPTWLFEGGYEFRSRGKDVYTDWQIRYQSYQTVFAGGFGITYGSMNVYHLGSGVSGLDEPVTTGQATKWEASLDEAGAQDMQHLFTLITSVTNEQFLDRIPDQSLIDGDAGVVDVGEGIRSSRLQATRGAKGDYAMIYSANGRNIRVKMDRLLPQAMNAFWFNPRNGRWQAGETEFAEPRDFIENIASGPNAPIQEFDPPGNAGDGNDWVLVLKSVD
ncbi:MAG: glycoside hydrolase family 140 protein [FCB group bacterium]|nr:glycoside hydrolase family 140 protein [FCB group bacterium]